MTPEQKRRLVSWGAFALGIVLFAATLFYIDTSQLAATGWRLGIAVPLALVASGLWHLTRTWAWAACFPRPRAIGFWRLARVRIAAEAFSYLTLRGIAGEPLKVVLLADEIDSRVATAAVALERIAYMVWTMLIVGIGSAIAVGVLPLSPGWFRVFRAFAVASLVLGALTAIVLTGRGTFAQALFERIERRFDWGLSRGRVARFICDVERLLLELVREDRRRLAVLIAATTIAYGCMAAEAWAVLWAVGHPIGAIDALTIETFSRVASFASAFIPANLGALEASSVAAVAAVGAFGMGASLALARRLRGLFWAGLGLAVYPRGRRPAARSRTDSAARAARGPVLLYLPANPAVTSSPFARLAGLPIAERVMRSAFRAHYATVLVLTDERSAPGFRRVAREIRGTARIATSTDEWTAALEALGADTTVTVVGAGTVVSPALLEDALTIGVSGPEDVRDVPAGRGWPVSGVLRARAMAASRTDRLDVEIANRILHRAPLPSGVDVSKGDARLAIRVVSGADLPEAEETLRRSSYKQTDNTLARFNRRMSLPISVALIPTPLTANQLSVALVAIGFYSAWLFSLGDYWSGVLAGALSLAASVLDGCDGEIARLKYQESALGCWIETAGDYSYYVAIFVGLTVGAIQQTGWAIFYWLGGIALAGTLITFGLLIFLRNRITAGHPERLHEIGKRRFKAEPSSWSRIIWRIAFVATRSAMPYGIMALALLDLLPVVVILAAIGSNVYWIVLLLKMRHLLGQGATETVAA